MAIKNEKEKDKKERRERSHTTINVSNSDILALIIRTVPTILENGTKKIRFIAPFLMMQEQKHI
jgi:hypothetical protein